MAGWKADVTRGMLVVVERYKRDSDDPSLRCRLVGINPLGIKHVVARLGPISVSAAVEDIQIHIRVILLCRHVFTCVLHPLFWRVDTTATRTVDRRGHLLMPHLNVIESGRLIGSRWSGAQSCWRTEWRRMVLSALCLVTDPAVADRRVKASS